MKQDYGYYADVMIGTLQNRWGLKFQVEGDWGRHRCLSYARRKGYITSYDIDFQILNFVRRQGWFPKGCILLSGKVR